MGVGMALSGALYNRVGPGILAVMGVVLLVVGTYGLTRLDVNPTGQSLQIWLILRGLGLGFANPPLQTLAMSAVSNRAMAKASSLVSVTRIVASAIGVAGLNTQPTPQATTQGLAIRKSHPLGLVTYLVHRDVSY